MTSSDDLRLTITDLDREGAGVGVAVGVDNNGGADRRGSPREIHVAGALPGDDVSARVVHRSTERPVAWAALSAIHRASPDRVPPACAAQGRCGGCVLQCYAYPAQIAWKAGVLGRLIAHEPTLRHAAIAPVVASPLTLGYRNKSKLVAGRDEPGRVVLGAYAPRSHDVVDLAGCAVVEPPLDDVASVLGEILIDHAVAPYDEQRLVGCLRYVVLRANARREVLVTLVIASELAAVDAVAAALRARRPDVVGVVANLNSTRGNAIYGAHERTLAGSATFEDEIGGVRLRVSSRAFFQANRRVAAAAYAAIASAARLTGTERVVDAYAGIGGIALTLAGRARSVVGIEEHASAVDDASASAALNDAGNARFVAGDVAHELERLAAADVVVLNPPRKGCARSVLDRAAALGPRSILYLSCAPETLVRDLAVLAGLGYATTAVTPFDMLPHTPHLEALAVLTRRDHA